MAGASDTSRPTSGAPSLTPPTGRPGGPLGSILGMQPDEENRVARLERQVAFMLLHLGLDPDLAAAGQKSTFGSPADIFGTQPAGFAAAQADFAAAQAGFAAPPVPPPAAPPAAPWAAPGAPEPADDIPPALRSAIERGKMIEAIKIYRQMTGLGLDEAKRAVEEMGRRQR
jgi:ribosomal protein L7/L12